MADRNRELVPDNWSVVRERALHDPQDFVRNDSILNTRGICRRASGAVGKECKGEEVLKGRSGLDETLC